MKRRNTALQAKSGKKRSRSHMQSVRLSVAERAQLRRCARELGVSVSDYVRLFLLRALKAKRA